MAGRFYGYQYDTNPRKLSPENAPIRNRYSRNGQNSEVKTETTSSNRRRNRQVQEDEDVYLFEKQNRKKVINENNTSNNVQNKASIKEKMMNISENVQNAKKNKVNFKAKMKIVMFLITGFSVLFAISYQNSLINESFNKKEQYKKEAEALSKTNQQMEVNIENSLNLKNIEQVAKEKIGMQKLSNNQKIYVNLPKQDYVAPAAEQVIMEEESGFWSKIVRGFTKAIK